jgi:hypothetical protein
VHYFAYFVDKEHYFLFESNCEVIEMLDANKAKNADFFLALADDCYILDCKYRLGDDTVACVAEYQTKQFPYFNHVHFDKHHFIFSDLVRFRAFYFHRKGLTLLGVVCYVVDQFHSFFHRVQNQLIVVNVEHYSSY